MRKKITINLFNIRLLILALAVLSVSIANSLESKPQNILGVTDNYLLGLAFERGDGSIEWATTDFGPSLHTLNSVPMTAGLNRYGSPTTASGSATIQVLSEILGTGGGVFVVTISALSPDGNPEEFIHSDFDLEGFITMSVHLGTGLAGFNPIDPGCMVTIPQGHVNFYYDDLNTPFESFSLGNWDTSISSQLSAEIDIIATTTNAGVGLRKIVIIYQPLCQDPSGPFHDVDLDVSSSIFNGSEIWAPGQIIIQPPIVIGSAVFNKPLIVIDNLGTTDSLETSLRLFLSTDSVINESDILLGYFDNISPITAGDDFISGISSLIPQATPDDFYFLGAQLSSYDTNSSNNIWLHPNLIEINSHAQISVNTDFLDNFGTGVPIKTIDTFTINNVGAVDLLIESIEPSISSANLFISTNSPGPFTIPKGGSHLVTVTVNPNAAPIGQTSWRLLVNSNDPDDTPWPSGVFIGITGPVDPPMANFTPIPGTLVSFLDPVTQGETSVNPEIVAIENVGFGDMFINCEITGSHPNDFFLETPCPATAISSFDAKVFCSPTAGGTRTAVLNVTTNDTNNTNVSWTLSCQGIAVPLLANFTPVPGTLVSFLDPVIQGETSVTPEIVTIENLGFGDMFVNCEITGSNPSDFFLEIPCPANPISSFDAKVLCSPTVVGTRTAVLNVTTNDTNNANVSWPLSCQGVSVLVFENSFEEP